MAFYSGFFNSKGLDRTYTAEDFTSYLSSIICNGVDINSNHRPCAQLYLVKVFYAYHVGHLRLFCCT